MEQLRKNEYLNLSSDRMFDISNFKIRIKENDIVEDTRHILDDIVKNVIALVYDPDDAPYFEIKAVENNFLEENCHYFGNGEEKSFVVEDVNSRFGVYSNSNSLEKDMKLLFETNEENNSIENNLYDSETDLEGNILVKDAKSRFAVYSKSNSLEKVMRLLFETNEENNSIKNIRHYSGIDAEVNIWEKDISHFETDPDENDLHEDVVNFTKDDEENNLVENIRPDSESNAKDCFEEDARYIIFNNNFRKIEKFATLGKIFGDVTVSCVDVPFALSNEKRKTRSSFLNREKSHGNYEVELTSCSPEFSYSDPEMGKEIYKDMPYKSDIYYCKNKMKQFSITELEKISTEQARVEKKIDASSCDCISSEVIVSRKLLKNPRDSSSKENRCFELQNKSIGPKEDDFLQTSKFGLNASKLENDIYRDENCTKNKHVKNKIRNYSVVRNENMKKEQYDGEVDKPIRISSLTPVNVNVFKEVIEESYNTFRTNNSKKCYVSSSTPFKVIGLKEVVREPCQCFKTANTKNHKVSLSTSFIEAGPKEIVKEPCLSSRTASTENYRVSSSTPFKVTVLKEIVREPCLSSTTGNTEYHKNSSSSSFKEDVPKQVAKEPCQYFRTASTENHKVSSATPFKVISLKEIAREPCQCFKTANTENHKVSSSSSFKEAAPKEVAREPCQSSKMANNENNKVPCPTCFEKIASKEPAEKLCHIFPIENPDFDWEKWVESYDSDKDTLPPLPTFRWVKCRQRKINICKRLLSCFCMTRKWNK